MQESSEIITVRVPKGTKSLMRKLSINWSQEFRNYIEDKLRAARLLKVLDEVRRQGRIKVYGDSTETIRHYRDTR